MKNKKYMWLLFLLLNIEIISCSKTVTPQKYQKSDCYSVYKKYRKKHFEYREELKDKQNKENSNYKIKNKDHFAGQFNTLGGNCDNLKKLL